MKITAVVDTLGKVEVEMVVWTCPSCGILYAIPKAYADDLRTNGGGYHCPNGHWLSWPESEADKLRKKLADAEREREWFKDGEKRARQSLAAAEASRRAYKGQVTQLRKRAIAGTCAFCKRHFVNVERHVATKHPAEQPKPPEVMPDPD